MRIVEAASLSSREQRLQAWSQDPVIERALEQTNYAGVFPKGDRPLAALILNNAAAGKLDYYLQRSVTYARTGCGSRRDVVVTIELTNSAPAHGLPPYVTDRLDADPPPDAKPGDTRTLLDYYTGEGALLENVMVNGKRSTANTSMINGRTVVRIDVELPRATTQKIELHLNEPAGSGSPVIWRQPGVNPVIVNSRDQDCG